MTSTGGPIGNLMIALIALLGSDQGETTRSSLTNAEVPFPPAAPTSLNLGAICQKGHHPDTFQASSLGLVVAISASVEWPSTAWSHGTVCAVPSQKHKNCAVPNKLGKKPSLSSVWKNFPPKTMVYECCEYKGDARWGCFESELPNLDYSCVPGYIAPNMPSEPGFTFNQGACQM